MGRREKPPTPEQTKVITSVIASFGEDQEAYSLAGVPKASYYAWLDRGRDDQEAGKRSAYSDFLDTVTKARSARVIGALSTIQKAAKEPKHWQAALALLRVTDPKRFSERVRVSVDEELDDAIQRLRSKLSPEEYERALSAILEGEGRPGARAPSPGESSEDDSSLEALPASRSEP